MALWFWHRYFLQRRQRESHQHLPMLCESCSCHLFISLSQGPKQEKSPSTSTDIIRMLMEYTDCSWVILSYYKPTFSLDHIFLWCFSPLNNSLYIKVHTFRMGRELGNYWASLSFYTWGTWHWKKLKWLAEDYKINSYMSEARLERRSSWHQFPRSIYCTP